MWWKTLIFLVMTWVIVAAFIFPAPQQQIGDASRIFYFHVPQAWVAVLAFAVSMGASIRYLRKGDIADDCLARAAASLGFLFCILAAITGSIFAKVAWNAFWNWDPRQTSVFILLLIYGAYFALRSAIEGEEKRARLAAVYSIFAFITVPFLVFILPRIMPSLHPSDSIVDTAGKITMSPMTASVFFPALAVFTAIFIWVLRLELRFARLERRLIEESVE